MHRILAGVVVRRDVRNDRDPELALPNPVGDDLREAVALPGPRLAHVEQGRQDHSAQAAAPPNPTAEPPQTTGDPLNAAKEPWSGSGFWGE